MRKHQSERITTIIKRTRSSVVLFYPFIITLKVVKKKSTKPVQARFSRANRSQLHEARFTERKVCVSVRMIHITYLFGMFLSWCVTADMKKRSHSCLRQLSAFFSRTQAFILYVILQKLLLLTNAATTELHFFVMTASRVKRKSRLWETRRVQLQMLSSVLLSSALLVMNLI